MHFVSVRKEKIKVGKKNSKKKKNLAESDKI